MNFFFAAIVSLLFLGILLELRYRLHKPLSLEKHVDMTFPMLCSHRGHGKRGNPAENTLPAFLASEKKGFVFHELDVRQSKEKNIFLFHGPFLDGQSDGKHKRLETYTDAQLAKLNFANYLKDGSFQKITSLTNYFQNMPNAVTNIEVKRDWFDFNFTLEKKISLLVREHKKQKKIFVSSFNIVSMLFNKIYFADVPNGILFSHNSISSVYLWFMLRLLLPDSIHAPNTFVTEKKILAWKKKGFNVAVWTVNNMERVQQLVKWKADVIITDNIDLMNKITIV